MAKNQDTRARVNAVNTKLSGGRVIKQKEMSELRDKYDAIEGAKRALKSLESEVEVTAGIIQAKLQSGYDQEDGDWTCGIDVKERVTPRWKEAFERELGSDAIAAEVARTEPSITRKVFVVRSAAITRG